MTIAHIGKNIKISDAVRLFALGLDKFVLTNALQIDSLEAKMLK